jgi:uncharacterized cupredoxin-like copper-binding protein
MYNRMRQLSSGQGRLPVLALMILLFASACSAGLDTGALSQTTLVRVTERDFQISATPNHFAAGDVQLVLRNKGPDTHELILVRSRGRLPLRPDGMTVDEQRLSVLAVGSIEGIGPGSEGRVHLHLAPGRYELFCNMAGHFMAGMHAELVVS